jgi:hypothetical protein
VQARRGRLSTLQSNCEPASDDSNINRAPLPRLTLAGPASPTTFGGVKSVAIGATPGGTKGPVRAGPVLIGTSPSGQTGSRAGWLGCATVSGAAGGSGGGAAVSGPSGTHVYMAGGSAASAEIANAPPQASAPSTTRAIRSRLAAMRTRAASCIEQHDTVTRRQSQGVLGLSSLQRAFQKAYAQPNAMASVGSRGLA